MSSQKLGGGLAPYLTNEAGHHSQVTLPQLDTAGRVRQPHRALSARETRSRPRQDRNNRGDEEPRFNVGPRSFRPFAMNRGGRRAGRPDRNTIEPFYEASPESAYPDYPPPTFQEAMAETASISSANVMSDVASDVASVLPPAAPLPGSSSTIYDTQVQELQLQQDPDLSLCSSNASTILAPRESDVESISSLEIVEADPVQERVPSPAQEHSCNCAERKVDFPSSAKVGNRGRQGARSRLNLAQDSDEDEPISPPQPQSPTKRRNLSLSPLRTLFPFKNSEPYRAHTALPTAHNSPYSHHTPFMSATSLPMKMSMSTTSFAHSLKAESLFGRKFLSFKGKERASNTADDLATDDWEVVEREERPSLCSVALEMGASPISPPASPTQGSSTSPAPAAKKKATPPPSPNKTDPLPPTPSSPEARPAPPPVENRPAATPQARSLNEPHELSLRDKKVPLMPKHVSRTHRQRHERRPPPPPEINMPLGPIITTVRTRMNVTTTPSAQQTQQQTAPSSTAGSNATQAASPPPSPPPPPPPPPVPPPNYTPRAVNKTTLRVPRSPLHQSISVQPEPPMTPIFLTPPSTPVKAAFDSRVPTPDPLAQASGSLARNRNSAESHSPSSTPYQTPRQGLSPNVSTADLLEFTSGSSAASRRHYSGRPLPRPPGANQRIVDSVYASADDENPVPNCCPEGLLINLDDEDRPVASSPKRENILINLDDEAPSPTSTTPTPSVILPASAKTQPIAIPLAETPSTSSLEEIPGSPVEEEDPVTPPRSPPRARASHSGPFLEVTDLDMLVNRLDQQTGPNNGSDYETLLTLTDFMGPASPNTVNRSRRCSARITERSRTSMVAGENVALAANVREVRRRITKDGRVKLKLVLLDISVDKCGICFSQFREADEARLGSLCKHAFHDKCLSPWLATNQTCPMCRVALYDF